MIARPWIVGCEYCPAVLQFSEMRPDSVRSCDTYYDGAAKMPMIPRSMEEIITEAIKAGWRHDGGDKLVCPTCRLGAQEEAEA